MNRAIHCCSLGLARTLIAVAKVLYTVVGITFAAFLMAGLWDLAVWAFKADWRTSHFEVPAVLLLICLLLGFAAYLSYLIGRGFSLAGSEESEDPGTATYYLMVVAAGILILGTAMILL